MVYKSLYNNPSERENITYSWVYWDGAFSTEELSKITTLFDNNELDESTIVGETDINEIEKIRKSKIKFIEFTNDTLWIFSRFNDVIQRLNESYYNYNLNGYEKIQYTVYQPDGKYDWHQDMINGSSEIPPTRKLSVVMNLTNPDVDYEGGEFQILQGSEPETINIPQGRIIAFPSYTLHRVLPVTKGIRKSLVIWVIGPKFV